LATRVKVERGRIPLQKNMVERLGQPDVNQISVWLFVVDPGHLRVFSQQEVDNRVNLQEFATADALALETRGDRERLAVLRLRLTPTEIVPERRLKIPSGVFDVCGEYLDRTYVWLEHSAAHLDIFTVTYVQRLLEIPPSRYLPSSFDRE